MSTLAAPHGPRRTKPSTDVDRAGQLSENTQQLDPNPEEPTDDDDRQHYPRQPRDTMPLPEPNSDANSTAARLRQRPGWVEALLHPTGRRQDDSKRRTNNITQMKNAAPTTSGSTEW